MRVSTVIPLYNAEQFIAEAITSVLQQTRPADEVIVVDDGSTDRSREIAEQFGPPVRVIHQENRGEGAARNTGVAVATGDVIAFLDSDDRWRPEKLEHQVAYLEAHPEIGAASNHVGFFGEGADDWISSWSDAEFRSFTARDFLLGITYLNQSAAMVRAGLARQVPYPNAKNNADMIQAAELRTLAPFGRVEEVLTECRVHPRQVSHRVPSEGFIARAAWAREHYQELGAATPAEAAAYVLMQAADWAMIAYYERDFDEFRLRRHLVRAIWHEDVALPKTLTRPIPPPMLYKIWDGARQVLRSTDG